MDLQQEAGWVDLGLIDYKQAWDLQLQLVEKRKQDQISDLLLFCEHPHVVTIGRRLTGRANILSHSFPVYEVERGGDATYHGPGQLVGYFILKLKPEETDPHVFLRKVETALIQVCQSCQVPAFAKEKYTGVWTKPPQERVQGQKEVQTEEEMYPQPGLQTEKAAKKIASLGVSIRQGILFHGFALNVTTDLSCFSVINPCGLSADVMTSLEKEGGSFQGRPVSVHALLELTAQYVGEELGRNFQSQKLPALEK